MGRSTYVNFREKQQASCSHSPWCFCSDSLRKTHWQSWRYHRGERAAVRITITSNGRTCLIFQIWLVIDHFFILIWVTVLFHQNICKLTTHMHAFSENQSFESEIICPLINTSLPFFFIAVLVLKTKERVIKHDLPNTGNSYKYISNGWNRVFALLKLMILLF